MNGILSAEPLEGLQLMDGTYHQTPPEPYIPTSKYQQGGMLKTAEPGVVGISVSTLSGYLEKRRKVLGEINYQLLLGFIYTLRSEGQSPWSIYTALQRVAKFATFLKNYGRCLANPDPVHFTVFLSMQRSRENIRRHAAALKKFYKFMKEKVDKRYAEIYDSFKVPNFKVREYLSLHYPRLKSYC